MRAIKRMRCQLLPLLLENRLSCDIGIDIDGKADFKFPNSLPLGEKLLFAPIVALSRRLEETCPRPTACPESQRYPLEFITVCLSLNDCL